MKRIPAIIGAAWLFLPPAAAWSAADNAPASGGIAIIKSIRSPQDLLFPHFPKRYCVPVTLSGTIAEEMKRALDSLKTEPPEYRELFNGKTFSLILANENYSTKTRELVSGILNPVEIIDIIVESVVKYRQSEKYAELTRETQLRKEAATYDGRPAFVITLMPKGDRFGYSYRDMGALIHESWLTELSLTIDSATNVVLELTAGKHSRIYEAGAAEQPPTEQTKQRYTFSYISRDGILLPSRLTVSFNTIEVLSIEASYRKWNNRFVFDTKKICSSFNGKSACLIVDYRDYRTGGCDSIAIESKNRSANYGRNLEHASELSREATEKFRKGHIADCVRLLQKLVERYGDTPQAVEAKRLLSQLPGGLQ